MKSPETTILGNLSTHGYRVEEYIRYATMFMCLENARLDTTRGNRFRTLMQLNQAPFNLAIARARRNKADLNAQMVYAQEHKPTEEWIDNAMTTNHRFISSSTRAAIILGLLLSHQYESPPMANDTEK
jgi:hypothetical protein